MLTKSLSCEWADKGIRVNAMCLGYLLMCDKEVVEV